MSNLDHQLGMLVQAVEDVRDRMEGIDKKVDALCGKFYEHEVVSERYRAYQKIMLGILTTIGGVTGGALTLIVQHLLHV